MRAIGALLLAGLAAAACDRAAVDLEWGFRKPRNVILISLDTLRADHLGCYGYSRDTSPNLDAFANEAVLFERLMSTGGRTLPIHISMLTSLYPQTHGIRFRPIRPDLHDVRLHDRWTTLAEDMRRAGLRTAAFTGGGWMSGKFGFDRGFQRFSDAGGGLAAILPKAKRWLRRRGDKPFFLFLHTYDVHSGEGPLPYQAPDGYAEHWHPGYAGDFTGCSGDKCGSGYLVDLNERARKGEDLDEELSPDDLDYIVDLYDGGITYTDDRIGRFFGWLRRQDLYDDSLIIVTSDHGEEFMEHGRMLHEQQYAEVAFVPLIVRFPGGAYGGTRIDALVATVDLLPTILDAMQLPEHAQAQGVNLLPLLRGAKLERDAVLATDSVRDEGFTYFPFTRELFRWDTDPEEREEVGDRHPEERARLAARYEALATARRGQAAPAGEPVELTEDEVDALRALGYTR